MRITAILGPQRHKPCVRAALRAIGGHDRSPVALISAGWEEREREHDELQEHVECPVVNLEIFHRVEDIYRRDGELHAAMRTRNDRMRRLQDLYRLRLGHALAAAGELIRLNSEHDVVEHDLVEPERTAAIEAVRTIDAHHLERLRQLHHEFWAQWHPEQRPAIARHRDELRELLGRCQALCVAGGHVGILLDRLRLLGLLDLVPTLPVIAWSAGAMALSDRVVLFHDSPPQGSGNAEVFEAGLGVLGGVVPLPHAQHRLHLEDRTRVALFARRFAPDLCLPLFGGERLTWNGTRWSPHGDCRLLLTDGSLAEVAA